MAVASARPYVNYMSFIGRIYLMLVFSGKQLNVNRCVHFCARNVHATFR